MTVRNAFLIDSRIPVESIAPNLPEHSVYFVINDQEDGILQMQALLQDYDGLDSIHVISHGAPGTLHLGRDVIDLSHIQPYEAALQAIGTSLKPGGDFLLYGCDIGAGQQGQALADSLAQATGADVALSSDTTGRK